MKNRKISAGFADAAQNIYKQIYIRKWQDFIKKICELRV